MKDFKEEKKIDIRIIKEEDGIRINIHGTMYHKMIWIMLRTKQDKNKNIEENIEIQ
jgi:hypothetical protein